MSIIDRSRGLILALVLLLSAMVTSPAFAGGGSNLDQAWAAFSLNELDKAEEYFKAAIKGKDNIEEASLGLGFTYVVMENSAKAAGAFDIFLENADNPYPYLTALFTTDLTGIQYGGKNNDRALKLLESLLEDEKAPGQLKGLVRMTLGRHYRAINEFDKAEEQFDKIGAITEWQLAGVFENISASGFDNNYEPITHPEPTAKFVNKNGAPVEWIDLPGTRDRWVDLTYHFMYGNSVVFAQSFVNSPDERDVQLRIGTSGSVKVWINDELILKEEEELNNDLDNYVVNTHLRKGNNRLLVQVGESELSALNFLARITNEQGMPMSDLTFSKRYATYPKGTGTKAVVVKSPTEIFFYNKIEKEPANLLNYMILAEALNHNGKGQESREALTKALKVAPQNSFVHLGLISAYNTLENETETSMLIEKLKNLPGATNFALQIKINEAFDNKDIEEAGNLINQLEETYHEDITLIMYKIRLASSNQNLEELVKLAESAYKKYPENYAMVNMKYALEREMKGNVTGAVKLLDRYAKENFNYQAITTLSDHYFEAGNDKKGFAYLEKLLEANPIATGYLGNISQKYAGKGEYDRALEYAKRSLAIAPFVSATYSKIGKIYEEKGEDSEAKKAYEKALVYDPTEYEVRKRLRKLNGEKEDMFARFDDPDVDALLKNAPSGAKYPEDNSLILLDEVTKVVYEGGASEERHNLVAKVFNPAGIDSWKEYYVPYYGNESFLIEKAEVIKKDGSHVKADVQGNHVVFTALEEGDGIYLSFRKKIYFFGGIKGHFWDQHYFTLFYPSLVSRYRLLTHNSVQFNHEVKNNRSLKPEIANDGDYKLHTWEKTNNPAVYYEDYMPVLIDVGEVLHVSSLPSWDYIAQWYERLSRTKAKTSPEVKEAVAGLWEQEPSSDTEKAKKIYDYIVKNIRYSSIPFRQSGLIPQKASKVINTKIGDCKDVSTLFVAMCKEAGLKADLVLVNTNDNGRYGLLLPSINFNHCIAKVKLDEEEYFVELTSDYLPFSSVHHNLRNSFVLEIDKYRKKEEKEPMLLDPANRKKNIVSRETKIAFDGMDMNLSVSSVKTGDYASWMRQSYRDIGKDRQEKHMLESIGNSLSGVKLKKLRFDENLKTTSDTVSYLTEYSASNGLKQLSSLLLFQVPYNEKQMPVDFLSNQDRKYPVDFWQYWAYDETTEVIEVDMPEDKNLLELPENKKINCFMADYSLTFNVKGRKLIIKRDVVIKQDYMPVDKLEETRAFFEEVVAADDMQIAFK
ncbi:transglutaminase domain-containing protein [Roseivirga sp. BDSF3-8]|uniref:transglutaminase domain-containing protein n=1 Tax=Roseivirga sp. BDSF3-8 TaxID=3241598 RepID=UPI003531E787